jgi:hypothetical protein
MRPGCREVLRFASGSHLRVVLQLPPAQREAAQRACGHAGAWLHALEDAMLVVDRVDDETCDLRLHSTLGNATLSASRLADGAYRLLARLETRAGIRTFEIDGALMQTGGTRDAYLALRSPDGACQPIAVLHYGPDGQVVDVCLFAAAMARHVAPTWRPLLPETVALAQLVPVTQSG